VRATRRCLTIDVTSSPFLLMRPAGRTRAIDMPRARRGPPARPAHDAASRR
jgi:hypothetical protein